MHPVCFCAFKLDKLVFLFMAVPVDTGLTQTNCLWIFRTKLLHLQLACSYWSSRSKVFVRGLKDDKSWFCVAHFLRTGLESVKISGNTLLHTEKWNVPTCVIECTHNIHTHTKKERRANASRLAPSFNPYWSLPFLSASVFSFPPSLSRLWSEGASLLREASPSRRLISAKPMLQRWIHSTDSTAPRSLIHHLTLLRALLKAEGKEAGAEAAGEEERAPAC